jgi:hypothetical protein
LLFVRNLSVKRPHHSHTHTHSHSHTHSRWSLTKKMKTIAVYSHSIAPSIDGVCRRFTGILWELHRSGHDLILFTLEDQPLDLPPIKHVVRYIGIQPS